MPWCRHYWPRHCRSSHCTACMLTADHACLMQRCHQRQGVCAHASSHSGGLPSKAVCQAEATLCPGRDTTTWKWQQVWCMHPPMCTGQRCREEWMDCMIADEHVRSIEQSARPVELTTHLLAPYRPCEGQSFTRMDPSHPCLIRPHAINARATCRSMEADQVPRKDTEAGDAAITP